MNLGTLIVFAALVLLTFAAVLLAASVPLIWFLAAALLFFIGLIGPAFGCLVIGALVGLFAVARSD